MRKILQSKTASGLMWIILLVGFLHLHVNSSRAQNEVFDKNVIQKWKKYESFSQKIQGTVLWTNTTPGKNGRADLLRYKQNRECALEIVPGRSPGEELYGIHNPQYTARIKRSTSDPSNVVLVKYEPSSASESDGNARNPLDGLFIAMSPHFSYTQTRLSQLVINPSFEVTKIATVSHNGKDLVRVDHTYTYKIPGSKNNQQEQINGSLYFDPSQSWCLRRYRKSVEVMAREQRISHFDYEAEFETIDHPFGFPIAKSQTLHTIQFNYKNKQKKETRSRADYDLEVKEGPPDSEFTLAAFGLPEPGGAEPVNKSIPMYLWILLAAGVCAGIAIGFRYLARRRRLAATA
jgi:hypothetical protein